MCNVIKQIIIMRKFELLFLSEDKNLMFRNTVFFVGYYLPLHSINCKYLWIEILQIHYLPIFNEATNN